MTDDDLDLLQRRLTRERRARKQAERLLEDMSRNLYETNRQLEVAVKELRHLAAHDPLTGLANRRGLQEWLQDRHARATRTGTEIALLSIDLDHFKDINDTWGHAVGDELIRLVALRLLASIRQDDLVVRLGGDECLVALNGVHDLSEAVVIAASLLTDLRTAYHVQDVDLMVTASIGVALLHDDETPDDGLRRADAAMYKAKAAGGDGVFADSAPHSSA